MPRASEREGALLLLTVKAAAAQAQKDLRAFYGFVRQEGAKDVSARQMTARQTLRLDEDRKKSAARVAEAEAKAARQVQKSLLETERIRTEATRRQIALQREAERAADRAARAERRRPGGFAQAVMSSRFSLPGTDNNVMPLVGQTMRGGAGALAGMAAIGGLSLLASQGADAVRIAAELEKTLNVLKAQTGATDTEMRKIGETARALGADLTIPKASAADAATVMLTMAKAGFSLKDSMDSARGSLLLAAAANTDTGTAAEMVASQLKAFNLAGDQAGRVADLLAAAASNSLGEISDMGDAAQQSSAVFAAAKIPIEDMTTAIALMANAGIKGSDAGTSLKTMLIALQAPSKEAVKAMDALGIKIYDANGTMVPFREIVQRVSQSLEGLTQQERDWALKTIFGTDALRAANIVLGQGVRKFDEMSDKVRKSGEAAKLAEANTRGYAGAVEALKNATADAKERAVAPFLNILTDGIKTMAGFVGGMKDIAEAGADLNEAPWWNTLGSKFKQLLSDMQEYFKLSGQVAKFNATLPGRASQAVQDVHLFRTTGTATPEAIARAGRYDINVNANMTGAQIRESLDRAAAKAEAEAKRLQGEMRVERLQAAVDAGDDSEMRRMRERSRRERNGMAPVPAKSTSARRSGIQGLMRDGAAGRRGQSEADKKRREAEAAARATRMDLLQAALKTEQEKLSGMQFGFGETRAMLDKTTDDAQILALAKTLRAQADAIRKQQRIVANASKNLAIAGDGSNTRATGVEFRSALTGADRDRTAAENQINSDIADARKRQKDAVEKQAETARKQQEADWQRYEESARSYAERLSAEEEASEQALKQADSLQKANRLIDQITDIRRRQAGLSMQQGIAESVKSGDLFGIETSLLTFATRMQQLTEQQRAMWVNVGETFATFTYGPEPTREGAPNRNRESYRRIEESVQDSLTDIFSGRGGGSQSLMANIFATARNEAARSVVSDIGRGLTAETVKSAFTDFIGSLKDATKGMDLSAKSLMTAAVMINGALSLLGVNGGKKQKNSILGAVAGIGIGSLIPGGKLFTDALFGAGIGGILPFADGGNPEVGRMAWVGENGPEIFIPREPGTILNQRQMAAVGRAVGGGRSTVVNIGAIYDRPEAEYVIRRLDDDRDRRAGFPGG